MSGGQPLSHGHPEGPFLTQGATISSSKASPSPPTLVISVPKTPDVLPDENPKSKTGLEIDAAANNEMGQEEAAGGEVQADVSFMQALDSKDVGEIDRKVALHEGARTRLNMDDPEGFDKEESCDETPGIEGEGEVVPEATAQDPTDTADELADRVKRIIDAKAEHGIPKLRRLGEKQPPQETNYPDTALVTRAEQKRLKGIEDESAKKKRKAEKAAAAEAVAAFVRQPELTHAVGQSEAAVEVEHVAVPTATEEDGVHPSHDMRSFASAEGLIIYCDTCGKWQKHNAHRSKLDEQCEAIKEGTKSQRKLLRNHIVPGNGAKLPSHIRTKGGKRC